MFWDKSQEYNNLYIAPLNEDFLYFIYEFMNLGYNIIFKEKNGFGYGNIKYHIREKYNIIINYSTSYNISLEGDKLK